MAVRFAPDRRWPCRARWVGEEIMDQPDKARNLLNQAAWPRGEADIQAEESSNLGEMSSWVSFNHP